MDGIREHAFPSIWTAAAECIVFLFALLGCLEKIRALYPLVLALDALAAASSFFFVILWFFMKRSFHSDGASVSLSVLTLTVFISSIVSSSDSPRLLVAIYSLIESWALAVSLLLIGRKAGKILGEVYLLIIIFTVFYLAISLYSGIEKGEVRFSGLSDQSNSLAVVAATTSVICLSMIGWRRNIILTVLSAIFLSAVIALSAYTLTRADSRTSFFALVFSLSLFLVLTFLYSRDRMQKVFSIVPAVLLICAVIFLLLSSSRSEGRLTLSSLTSGRTTIWSETLSRMEIRDYLFGFGGNSAEMTEKLMERGMERTLAIYLGEEHLMHNIYIQFLVEYGIVSASAFICCVVFLFLKALSLMRRIPSSRALLIPSLSLFFFFLVHSLAESSIYFIGGEEQFLFLLSSSIIYTCCRLEEKR